MVKRIALEIGDIIELRKVETIIRPVHVLQSERQIVIDVEDTYVVLKSMSIPDKMSTIISQIDVDVETGKIIGTINRFLISRNLNDFV